MSFVGRIKVSAFQARLGAQRALLERRADVRIGAHTYGCPRVYAHPGTRLEIGRYCSIADEVVIFLGNEHRTDFVSTHPFNVLHPRHAHVTGHPATRGNVTIGNDVWLGYRAVILSGTTIGDGAVVGAGAIVSKPVPPYAIVAGSPARVVRTRFPPEIVERLLQVQWWTWEEEEVHSLVGRLMSTDVEAFLAEAERRAGTARR